MQISFVLYFVTILCYGAFGGPLQIPFLGVSQSVSSFEQYYTQKEGQLITGVSQITSFGFYISTNDDSVQNAYGCVGLWSSSGVTQIASIALTVQPSTSWTLVTANIGVSGLDPRNTYVVYLTFEPSPFRLNVLSQLVPPTGTNGAVSSFAPSVGLLGSNPWNTQTFDYVITLVSDNTIAVPNTNIASGPGNNPNGWNCIYQTTFTKIQVDWGTMLVNTAYTGGSTTSFWYGTNCAASGVIVPYGTAASCCNTFSPTVIDLSGTILTVADTFSISGYDQTGTVTPSNNGQTYTLSIAGWCGLELSSEATISNSNPGGGGGGGVPLGGFSLHLAYA